MLPRASFAKGLWLAGRAAKAGGACLGLALIVLSGDPAAILGLFAVVALVIGGVAWTAGGRRATWVRVILPVSALIAARIGDGPAAAALGAFLLALGASLRTRTEEVTLGLAFFAGMVVFLGGASPRLLLVSWALGAALVAVRAVAAAMWRGLRRLPILKSEKTGPVFLNSEK